MPALPSRRVIMQACMCSCVQTLCLRFLPFCQAPLPHQRNRRRCASHLKKRHVHEQSCVTTKPNSATCCGTTSKTCDPLQRRHTGWPLEAMKWEAGQSPGSDANPEPSSGTRGNEAQHNSMPSTLGVCLVLPYGSCSLRLKPWGA